ncbi:MAG: DUF484 family protein [Methylococcaceae bacterium]|nr:DUF484 family protein [Methylococcaceae bacterium]
MTEAKQTTVTENDVVNYLQQNPEFFQEQLALLEVMRIPHPSGDAISLISKQLELFRSKHHALENQLTELINIARENDNSFNRLHKLTLTLLQATSLEQVVINLKQALTEFFLTDLIAIRLIQEPSTPSALAGLFIAPGDKRLHYFQKELTTAQPFCGAPTDSQAEFLFGERASVVKSCAIIPMVYPQIKAILAIGHTDAMGFHADMGSIFLTQISEIAVTRLISLNPVPHPVDVDPVTTPVSL